MFEGEPADHQALGEALGVIDIERAAKVSGARFAYLMGDAVLLELALLRWAIDRVATHGFKPVMPPVLVREQALYGTGFFPEARDQVYAVEADDLFLVGTSEVSLAAQHTDEILDLSSARSATQGSRPASDARRAHTGRTPEASSGCTNSTRWRCSPSPAPRIRLRSTSCCSASRRRYSPTSGIPYRVVNTAAGDLGPAATKKYDIEAWFPSQQRYRELTSCSNTTDYQARRLRIRHRGEAGTELVHTLNGTAMAVPRTVAAIMENFQQPDGSVKIPEPLHSYTGFDRMTRRADGYSAFCGPNRALQHLEPRVAPTVDPAFCGPELPVCTSAVCRLPPAVSRTRTVHPSFEYLSGGATRRPAPVRRSCGTRGGPLRAASFRT